MQSVESTQIAGRHPPPTFASGLPPIGGQKHPLLLQDLDRRNLGATLRAPSDNILISFLMHSGEIKSERMGARQQ
jgi:hypothetical protein